MEISANDELRIYRGKDYVISDHIVIKHPTLDEICEYGESEYYSFIYNFTATPQSLKAQLWQMGVDYTTITPYQLFYSILYKMYTPEQTSILFGDLDFTKFELQVKEPEIVFDDNTESTESDDTKLVEPQPFLVQEKDGNLIIIDEYTYELMINYICGIHFIERDLKVPANNTTKMVLIEDAIEEMNMNKNKEHHSYLKNLVSAMVNIDGFKYNHEQVWNMKINAFMDSVRRIGKIKNANLLLQSGYSGFGIDLKKISNKQLDWLGELD